MGRIQTIVGLSALVAAYGCAMESGYEGDGEAIDTANVEGFAEDEENLGSVSQAVIDPATAVGVIPIGHEDGEGGAFGTACPAESELVTFRFDDEDNEPQTDWWGFYSSDFDQGAPWAPIATTRRGLHDPILFFQINSIFRFCRVNGKVFKPLTTSAAAKGRFYAVLKLGTTCPNGSLDHSRYFDNEDDENANSFSGPIAPNTMNVNTRLRFCFFRTGAAGATMSKFPTLGVPYAVFHDFDTSDQALFMSKHWHYTDDEDSDNANSHSPSGTPAATDFAAIIGTGKNTLLEYGRVK